MAVWAWWSLLEATIFIALVIFRVLLTEAMRLLISFKDGMIDLLPVSF